MIFRGALLLLCYQPTRVVGYNTITIPAGQQYALIAIPFDGIGADGISLYDLFGADPFENGFVGGGAAALSDQLQFWDGKTYKTLWLNGNSKALPLYKKWINNGATGWGTAGQPTTKTIVGGESFWIKRYVASTVDKSDKAAMAAALPAMTLTVAGQVIVRAGNQTEVDINPGDGTSAGYTLISASFSAPFIPNPDKVDGTKAKINWFSYGCIGGGAAALSDQIQIWDGQTYKTLWLNGNEKAAPLYGWWINNGATGWGASGQPSTVQIDPTVGFWYKRVKTGTESFKLPIVQPYSL